MSERPGARGPAFYERLLMGVDQMRVHDFVRWTHPMTHVATMPKRK